MPAQRKVRLKSLASAKPAAKGLGFGFMRGSVKVLGDLEGPTWADGPWDAKSGMACRGKNGPVYYTGNGTETTDDFE